MNSKLKAICQPYGNCPTIPPHAHGTRPKVPVNTILMYNVKAVSKPKEILNAYILVGLYISNNTRIISIVGTSHVNISAIKIGNI